MTRRLHLADRLDTATIEAPSPAHVQLQSIDVGGLTRSAIFCHPDARVRYALDPEARDGARLRFACGIKTRAWERLAAPVSFRVGVSGAGGDRWLWECAVDPRTRAEHRRWLEAEVLVPPAESLLLETTAERGDHAWAAWADPVLEGLRPRVRRRPRAHPAAVAHVVLVTADALRADLLTEAGVATPNLDALAADGLRFAHARAASVTTPSAYATLLTGTSPPRHGVTGEWGALPAHLPTLATELVRAGGRSVFAPSERELGEDAAGFARVFAEVVPCLGNPSQEGAVTTRRLVERLERAGDEPLFVWAHYFDTHPPRPLPPERVARHYDGDPRDPSRAHMPERIAAIRGSESLFYLDSALPGLREGRVDARLVPRLRDTARALAGAVGSAPDLAAHLPALGAEFRRGLDPRALGAWLLARADELDRGLVADDLVTWLADLRAPLREIERDSVSWLDGVVDSRYPLAHVRAAAEEVDESLGALVSFLREEGLYDQATLVFTSPHGELFGEGGNWFHHHALLEPVLRVPLVVKPPRRAGLGPAVIDGAFDVVDLLPTLLDALGLEPPRSCDGGSRLAELRGGGPLAPHDSFALGVDGVQACLVHGDVKLIRTLAPIPQPDGSWLDAGTTGWFDLSQGETPCAPPPESADLERRLDRWLAGDG